MPTVPQSPSLVKPLLELVAAHREALGQERVYLRIVALLLAELLAFGSHRLTDLLRALGCSHDDWTAWYRLFQRPSRFLEATATACLFRQTLPHVPADTPYVVAIDSTTLPRSSQRLEGTSWLRCPRNPPWRIGFHRAQRFLHGSWLTPLTAHSRGYSRAIPLRFLPAFPDKAVTRLHPPCSEPQAGSQFLAWVRQQLAQTGRATQPLLCLADGGYDKVAFWQSLPAHTTALVRTAKNRVLRHLPGPYCGRGRRRYYGERAPAPQAYLQLRTGWTTGTIRVRGRQRRLTFRVEGPFLREKLRDQPLFLLCVRGQVWKRRGHTRRRDPVFYLVNAVPSTAASVSSTTPSEWQLPFDALTLLSWAWQRWEVEVVHREVKSGFGLGDKQCFEPQAAIASVQWSAWVYALLMLVGYRAFGLDQPPTPTVAWHRPRRYTLATVLDACRLELLTDPTFSPLFDRSRDHWLQIEPLIAHWLAVARPPPQ